MLEEHALRLQRCLQGGATREKLDGVLPLLRSRLEQVQAVQDALLDAFGHRWHRIVLVVERQVVEDVLAALVHAPHAFANDHRRLECEAGVVHLAVGHRGEEQR